MIGLFLAVPFMLTHPSLPEENIGYAEYDETTNELIGSDPIWIGHIETKQVRVGNMLIPENCKT